MIEISETGLELDDAVALCRAELSADVNPAIHWQRPQENVSMGDELQAGWVQAVASRKAGGCHSTADH